MNKTKIIKFTTQPTIATNVIKTAEKSRIKDCNWLIENSVEFDWLTGASAKKVKFLARFDILTKNK